MKRLALPTVCLLLVAAWSDGASPPFQPGLGMKELMRHVIDPAADAFWESSGYIVTAQGEQDRAPTTDAGWDAAVNAAAIIAESGNLLMLPGRAIDQKEWMEYSRRLVDAGTAGMKAAQARDKNAVFRTGGEIYIVCSDCHRKYLFGR